MEGVTNGIAAYNPRYVTLDYACQYVRATRTTQLTNAVFDTVSGGVQIGLGGKSDVELEIMVFVGEGQSISNRPAPVPVFTNSVTVQSAAVEVPPVITTQPEGAAVLYGGSHTLSVAAAGTSPFVYQWRCNGTNLPSATNQTLAFSLVTLSSAGDYDVVVTNVAGAAQSSVAAITVTVPQTVLTGSIRERSFEVSFNTTPGGSYVVEYSPALPATSWFTLSNVLAYDTNASVFDPILPSSRFYRVRVEEGQGPEEFISLSGNVQPPQFLLGFNSITGLNYNIEYSGNLSNWQPLANVMARFTNTVYPDALVKTQRFYRVLTPLN
jgi:hypothetical protein